MKTKLLVLLIVLGCAACAEPETSTGNTDLNQTAGDPAGDDTSTEGEGQSEQSQPETDDAGSNGAGTDAPAEDDCEDSFVFVLKPEAGQVAKLMLVVDRSGSMNEGTRWADIRSGLSEVTTALESAVDFGLLLFPSAGLDACASGQVSVEPGSQNANSIITALDSLDPLGGTPTYSALETAGEWLHTNNAGGVNYILLATDGGPGCNMNLDWQSCECIPGATCMLNGANCLDAVRTSNEVLVLREQGIKTFVVGLPGTEGVGDLLDAMALAGGASPSGQHISVTNEAELTQALSSLSASVVPCSFELPFEATTAVNLGFTVDGEDVPRDESELDGWNFSGTQAVTLYGSWCNRLRDGEPHVFQAAGNCHEP